MCAIFGSYSRDVFYELMELNSYRGFHSYSISVYDPIKRDIKIVKKGLGHFDASNVEDYMGVYWIGHIQAPTTEAKSLDTVHPSAWPSHNTYMWHNGILKEDCIKMMQTALDTKVVWDTKLLHHWLLDRRSLSDVDGTFSCLMYEQGDILLFRNEISPMFIDDQLNISSTKFTDSVRTPANSVLKLDFINNVPVEVETFSTKENPYYFANGV